MNTLLAVGYRVFGVDPKQAHRHREILSSSEEQQGRRARLGDMLCTRRHQLREAGDDSDIAARGEGRCPGPSERDLGAYPAHAAVAAAVREYFLAILLICSELDVALTSRPVLTLLAKAPMPERAAKLTAQQILRDEHLGQPGVVATVYAASVRS